MLQQCKHWRRYVHSVYAEDLLSTVHKQWWKEMSRGIHSFIGERPNTIMTWWWGKYFSCSSRFKCIKYQHFATVLIKVVQKWPVWGPLKDGDCWCWYYSQRSSSRMNFLFELLLTFQWVHGSCLRAAIATEGQAAVKFTPPEFYSTRILLH